MKKKPSRLESAAEIFNAGMVAARFGRGPKGDAMVRFDDFYLVADMREHLSTGEIIETMAIWPVDVGPMADKWPDGRPVGLAKVFSAHRLGDRSIRLLSFRRGGWERRLLKAVGNGDAAAAWLSRSHLKAVRRQ